MGTLQVGGTTLGVKNTSTNKVDLSNVGDVTLTSSANIKGAINATGDAPIYACRAWVNFNGNGTVAIRSSGNVSSITDNGTGNYTVNFTTAMPDANYATVCSAANSGSTWPRIIGGGTHSNSTYSTSQVGIYIINPYDRSGDDQDRVQVAVFR